MGYFSDIMILYDIPQNWIKYNPLEILPDLVDAKAAVLALTEIPSQRSWSEKLQIMQLKREVAGTSRIEGADFTERELDAAMQESPEQLQTRSQRQAACAVATYKWIAILPDDRPITADLICEIHRLLITGADEDHCPPGKIRTQDQNVNFGVPKHRGVAGGEECKTAFAALSAAVKNEFRGHDALVQALALHYHFAAMHPFLDGNGRTARALEALMLQRNGLKDTLFIAMSNYYYEEKNGYLATLAEVRSNNNDLTAFLKFGLKGIKLQCRRLLKEITINVQKALFKNMMFDLFNRLQSPRKRVMKDRHLRILKLLLESDSMMLDEIASKTADDYSGLSHAHKALTRELNYLIRLGALGYKKQGESHRIFIRLEWPTEITESEFFKRVKQMPKSKATSFLA
jgi:Fic family protein